MLEQTARVDAITLSKSGTSGNPIRYWAYPGQTPVFDFSGMTDDCRIKGFDVTGGWIHLNGLIVTGVRQNNSLNHESWGSGSPGAGGRQLAAGALLPREPGPRGSQTFEQWLAEVHPASVRRSIR